MELEFPNAVNKNSKIHHNAKLLLSMAPCLSGFLMKQFSVGY